MKPRPTPETRAGGRGTVRAVIGVGSPFGDDAVGLAAAERLAARPPPGWRVLALDRPGARLVEHLFAAGTAIVIDAVVTGRPPGLVHDLALEAVAAAPARRWSSHGFGVAEALALAAALGRHPPRGRFLGVEIDPEARAFAAPLTPPVRSGLRRVVARAREWIRIARSGGSLS